MKKSEKPAPRPAPVIYCGPTIPGTAKQFTTYTEGIPEMLQLSAILHPAVAGLIVSLEKLPEVMRQLREGTGEIYIMYHAVQEQIKREGNNYV
ncbi:MAG: hypothetical protein RSB55_00335 [Oscillospiraceae bacterium]